jgi:acyl carrier protein
MDDLKDVILKYIIAEYAEEGDEITHDTPLISSGLVDSFSMVSLKRFLEMKYQIAIPEEDATPETFDSVERIAGLVMRFRAGSRRGEAHV